MPISPLYAGLVAGGAGLASAGGPSPYPMSFGQALGQAMQGGLAGAMQAQDLQRRDELAQVQRLQTMLALREAQRDESARDRRAQAFASYVGRLGPDQRALAEAAPDAALEQLVESQLGVAKPPPLRERVSGGQLIQEEWDAANRRWNQIGSGARWEPEAAPGTAETTAALQTREGKIQSYIEQGLDRQTSMLIVDNNLSVVPTQDGRLVAHNPITNQSVDITPEVRAGESLPEPARDTTVGGDLGGTVGPGPRASELVSKYVGGFVAGAGDPATDRKRANLRMLERQARSAFTVSGDRPSAWEQKLIQELFPSEGFFESPERAVEMLGQLKAEAAQTYNDYGEMLRDPGVQGAVRNELVQKRIELKRLHEGIQLPGGGGAQTGAAAGGGGSSAAASSAKAGDFSGMSAAEFGRVDLNGMSEAELDAYIAEGARRGLR